MVDGLPLAIELAAARMRVLSPAKLVDRLSKRFAVLRTSRRGASSRQTTLRGAIDWSWDLCTPAEQLALAQCSVFHAGFELEAAEATIDVSGFSDEPFVMDLVDSLVDKSLLRSSTATGRGGDEPRFGMYVSIQEYAAEKLRDASAVLGDDAAPLTGPDAQRECERRHGRWYAALGDEEAVEAFYGPDDVRVRAQLALEKANIAAALERAVEPGDAALVHPLAHAYANAIGRLGAFEIVEDLQRALAAVHLPAGPRSQLQGRLAFAISSWKPGRVAARRLHSEAIRSADESGDPKLAARARIDAHHWSAVGPDLERSSETLAAARRAANELGDERYVAQADRELGDAFQKLGRRVEARAAYERGLERAARIRTRHVHQSCLSGLAILSQLEGRDDEVFSLLRESIRLSGEVDDRSSTGHQMAVLADYLQQAGRVDEALAQAREALRVLAPTGNIRSSAIADYALAMAHLRLDEHDAAEASILAAVRSLEAVDDRHELAIALSFRARIAHKRGDDVVAQEALARARALIEETNLEPGSEPGVRVAQAAAILGAKRGGS